MRLYAGLLAAFTLLGVEAASAASITLSQNAFRLSGAAAMSRVPAADYQKIFKVGVDASPFTPMAGRYGRDKDVLTFTPAFPLTPGVTYRAEYRAGSDTASAKFPLPKPVLTPSTLVTKVTPTADKVPENLLKLYIHFSDSMSRGDVYRYVHLIDQSGQEVNSVFLQVGEELWDPRQTRLTLLFDPGRIKRGLVSQKQLGMALHAGRSYTLVVDKNWPDAKGAPLKAGFRKSFTVAAADRTALDPKIWKISAPKAASRTSLLVDFLEALDESLLKDLLRVTDAAGKPVSGAVTISKAGSLWAFAPASPWLAGSYRIQVPSILEDLAGNKIYSPFDVDVTENPSQRMQFKTHTLGFEVR